VHVERSVFKFEDILGHPVPAFSQSSGQLSDVWCEMIEMNSQVNSDGLQSALQLQREDCSCSFKRTLLDIALAGGSGEEIRQEAQTELQRRRDDVEPSLRFWSALFRWSLLGAATTTSILLLEIDAVHIWNPFQSITAHLVSAALMLCGLAVLISLRISGTESRSTEAGSMYAEGLVAIVEPDCAPRMRTVLEQATLSSRQQPANTRHNDQWIHVRL
jgi:hypothetical protein